MSETLTCKHWQQLQSHWASTWYCQEESEVVATVRKTHQPDVWLKLAWVTELTALQAWQSQYQPQPDMPWLVVLHPSLWRELDWTQWADHGAQRIPWIDDQTAFLATYVSEHLDHLLDALGWQQQQTYQKLFWHSPSNKCVFDIQSNCIIDANRSFLQLLGYDEKGVALKKFIDLFELHERYKMSHWFSEIATQHEALIQSRMQNHLGEPIDVTLRLAKVPFQNRQVWLAHVEDISHWLREDQEKKWALTQFGLLVQDSAEFVLILDSSARFTYISPNIEKRYLIDIRQYLTENAFDYIHPEDVQILRDAFGSLNETRRVHLKPFRYFGRHDQWRWFEGTLIDMRDQEPVHGFMVSVHDVTRQVKAERENWERHQRHQALVQSVHDLVYEHELSTQTMLFATDGYEVFFELPPATFSITSQQWLKNIHPLDYEVVAAFFEPVVQLGHYELDYRLQNVEGHYVWVADRFVVMENAEGQIIRIGAIQNIHQERLQEVLTQLEKDIYQINTRMQLSLQEVLERITLRLEKILPHARCTIIELRKNDMYPMAGKRMPDAYTQAITGVAIGPDVGSCGTAMFTRQPVWVDDVKNSPLWSNYQELIAPYTFRSCWSVPIFKSDGQVQGSFACYADVVQKPEPTEMQIMERISNLVGIVMENRRTSEAIKLAKERYEMVSLATRDIIWDWHIQADKIQWSRGLEEQFGHSMEQCNPSDSKWWFDHVHPEDSVHLSVQLYQFLNHRTHEWQQEYRFRCADGTYRYVLDKAYLVNDSEGQPYRLIGAMQDITIKKREEQRLKLLETVIIAAKDGVIIAEKHQDSNQFQLIFSNQAFGQITGYQADEIAQMDWLQWLAPQADKRDWIKLNLAFQNGHSCHIETQVTKADLSLVWVHLDVIPIKNVEGDITHWISIVRDISEMKWREVEKEKLIQELTQNNRDLKQFSYITSHNLRAPLSNLLGLLQLMEEVPIEDDELVELMDGFNKSTHLLNDTINDLVKVMVIKDNPNYAKEDVPLQELIDGLVMQTRYLSADKEPIWKFNLQDIVLVDCNKAYIESIFLNLMTNAIKYRHPNRPLEVTITAENNEQSTILRFSDNGIGIDLERNKDKIFGLYQRFHQHADSKGLGLYLVKSQIESMGGQIQVQSQVHIGTTFTITLFHAK